MKPNNLPKIPLLQKLTKPELELLGGFLLNKDYKDGQYIFTDGQSQDRLIIIIDGRAGLENKIGGQNQTIAFFKKDDFLGEMSIVSASHRHQHSLRALSNVKTLELHSRQWPTIIKKQPHLQNKLYQNICLFLNDRLTHADNKLLALFSLSQYLGQAKSLQAIAKKLLDITLEIIPSQSAAFMTFSNATQKLHIYESRGYATLKNNSYYPLHNWPLLENLARQPRTMIFESSAWPQAKTLLPGILKNTNIITPIRLPNKVLGFIILGNKHDQENFSTNNQILLEAMSMQVAAAIQQVRLTDYETAATDVKKVYIDPI